MKNILQNISIRILVLISFFILTNLPAAISQVSFFKGTVLDSASQEPVEFATIILNYKTGTITDELGNFQLPFSAYQINDTLTFTCIGYADKKVLAKELQMLRHNIILMRKSVYELGVVEIQTKGSKLKTPEKIISEAIDLIPQNYSSGSVVYKGYYREYLKDHDEILNLFESILNFEDFGITSPDLYNANLEYKRQNNDFRFDTSLFKPYDNEEKYVPMALVHAVGKNELAVLKSTYPIKIKRGSSISFIDNFRFDFLKNHTFQKSRLTYLNDRPFYIIPFEDNLNYSQGINKIKMNGTIYIDAENYGIKKINYLANIHSGVKTRKLYELNVEYSFIENKYYLHYISFNNLFKASNFAYTRAEFSKDTLQLVFNREIKADAEIQKNVQIYYDKEELQTKSVLVIGNILQIIFTDNNPISKRLKNLSPLSLGSKYYNVSTDILSRLSIDFNNLSDLQGNTLSSKTFFEYYQYREFFVHETITSDSIATPNLIDVSKPVFESELLAGGSENNISWFNTPLIKEKTENTFHATENRNFGVLINNLLNKNESELKETVYVQTDCEVYNPGDTLWFKGYIRNKSYLSGSLLSKSFFIQLNDSAGEMVWSDKFLMKDSDVTGQIFFPLNMKEGLYTITAYSSWMKNFESQEVFKKHIILQNDKPDGIRITVNYNKENYFPGDSIRLIIKCIDEYSTILDNVDFEYKIKLNNTVINRGQGTTSKSLNQDISIILPGDINSQPEIEIKASYKDYRQSNSFPMPVNYFVLVDFFPEGGHCLEGINSNIAFKAVTRNGLPVDIKAEIMDKTGKIIKKISSEYDGMGEFEIKASGTDSIFMRLSEPLAFKGSCYNLPEFRKEGWQLSVINRNDKLQIDILTKDIKNDTALLLVMVRNALVYYKEIHSEKEFRFSIPTKDMPNGIAVITLFDKNLIPGSERLAFIYDPGKTQTEIKSDRLSYKPRDSVDLQIKLPKGILYPEKGSWSLSVVDNQLCMSDKLDEPFINTYLLISPEIKGYIHNINSYLYPFHDKSLSSIDLLMLTQGWRDYKQIISPIVTKPVNREVISGIIYKQPFGSERQPVKGEVSVYFGGNMEVIEVGKNGVFSFFPRYEDIQNTGFFLSAKDENNKPQVSIALDDDEFQKKLSEYMVSEASKSDTTEILPVITYNSFFRDFSYNDMNHQWLEEVVITKTLQKKPFHRTDLAMSKKTASKEEIEEAYDVLDLWEIVDPNRANSEKISPFYCIDDMLQLDNIWAMHINPKDIEEYQIIKGIDAEAIYGFGIKYVIDIKLKPFDQRESNRLWESATSINKFAIAKEFYKPLYDSEQKRYNQLPDLRKTIHWDPAIKFDSDGTAVIRFYNGDRYTRIRCVLEGLDSKGFPVHAEYMYEVDTK